MVRTVTTKTRHTIVHAAKRGAKNVKAVAGEAIGAAAKAATEVVLEKTNAALAAGRAKLTRSTPARKRAPGRSARARVDKTQRSPRGGKKNARPRAPTPPDKNDTTQTNAPRRKKDRR